MSTFLISVKCRDGDQKAWSLFGLVQTQLDALQPKTTVINLKPLKSRPLVVEMRGNRGRRKSVFAQEVTFLSTLAVKMHKVYTQRQKGLKV